MLTQQRLKKLLNYDPTTGVFTWRVAKSRHVKIGQTAGTINSRECIQIMIDGKRYVAHRLAWLYIFGAWPSEHIDHINTTRFDNRIENLREATHVENAQNARKQQGARCRLKGVYVDNNKFRARIRVGPRQIHLGMYDTEEEAHAAYMMAARTEFGAFARAE